MAAGILRISTEIDSDDGIRRMPSGLSIRTPKHKKIDPVSAPVPTGTTKNTSPFPEIHSPYSHGKSSTDRPGLERSSVISPIADPFGRISPPYESDTDEEIIFRLSREQRAYFNVWKRNFVDNESHHFNFTFIPVSHFEFEIRIEHISGVSVEIKKNAEGELVFNHKET